MDGLLDRFVHIAWMHCWQVTLLILLVGALVWCFGRSRPHLASVLWLLVIVKCLTPPIWSSPSGIFCWLQPVTTVLAVEAAQPIEFKPLTAQQHAEEIVVQVAPDERARAEWSPPLPSPAATIAKPTTISWQRSVAAVLAIGWFSGLLAGLLWMTRRWRRCWRQILSDRVPSAPELNELLRELQQRLGVRRHTQLLVTSSAVGPAVVGLWRPTIVLPLAVVANKRREDIEPLLAHELVHIRRGDLWVAMLQLIVQCLWWFHPLVRWANQWLTRETERSCDEEVIGRLGCNPRAYARSLLTVLEVKQLRPVPTFPGVRPVDVTKQRLERIMQLGQGCRRQTPWWCWAIMAVLALITLPGAALLVRGKDPPAKILPKPTASQLISTAAIGEEVPTAGPQAEMTTTTYVVHDLLEKLHAEIVDNSDEAARYLEGVLRSALIVDVAQKQELQFGWHDGRLVVRTTAAGQRVIAEQLELYRQSGFVQYVFEVRLLQASAGLQQAVKADWRAIQPKADSELGKFDVDFEGDKTGHVVSTVNRQTPVISTLFDEPQMRTFMTQAQADKDMNFISAPKITTFNGQSVRIEQLERRPFVVAVKEAEKGVFQPEIRVVDVGSKLRLRARGLKNGKIKVDFARAESEITSVEERNLLRGATVQIPQVAVSRLQTQVEMLPDQTYVVGGLESLHDANKPHLWLLVTVRKLDEADLRDQEKRATEKDAAVRSVGYIENQGVQPERVTKFYQVADVARSLPDAQLLLNGSPKAPAVQVAMRSDGRFEVEQTKTPDLDSVGLINLITSTIEPDSWVGVGGEGTIEFTPQQSSLLVSQYESIHERIDDLLGQLRRLQQTTVVLNFDQVWIPTEDWQKLADKQEHNEIRVALDKQQGFVALKTARLIHLLKHDARKQTATTKVIAYNGQLVALQPADEPAGKSFNERLQLRPIIDRGRNSVHLQIEAKSKPSPEAQRPSLSGAVSLDDTTSLVLDLDCIDGQAHELSDRGVKKAEYRRLLVVTAEIFATQGNVAKRAKTVSMPSPQ